MVALVERTNMAIRRGLKVRQGFLGYFPGVHGLVDFQLKLMRQIDQHTMHGFGTAMGHTTTQSVWWGYGYRSVTPLRECHPLIPPSSRVDRPQWPAPELARLPDRILTILPLHNNVAKESGQGCMRAQTRF